MTTEKRNLTITSDPGHGWLSVSLKDLKDLGITDKISSYSYMNLTRAYLEEDQDLTIFTNAAKAKGWELNIKESTVDSTPIRGYASYNEKKLGLALELKEGIEVILFNSTQKTWSTKAKVTQIEGSKVFIECEFGNKYRVSKGKFLDSVKPVELENVAKLKM